MKEQMEQETRAKCAYVPPRVEVFTVAKENLLAVQSFGGNSGTGFDDEGGGGAGTGIGGGGGAGSGTGRNDGLIGTLGAKEYFGYVEYGDLWEE